MVSEDLASRLEASAAEIVIGPRSGSKTENLTIPEGLAPGALRDLLNLNVVRVESLGPGVMHQGELDNGETFVVENWLEHVICPMAPEIIYAPGGPAVLRNENAVYLPVWSDENLLQYVLKEAVRRADLPMFELPEGLRLRRSGDLVFATNYGQRKNLEDLGIGPEDGNFLYGAADIARAGVSIWRD